LYSADRKCDRVIRQQGSIDCDENTEVGREVALGNVPDLCIIVSIVRGVSGVWFLNGNTTARLQFKEPEDVEG
jgi:hypothetical protein